MRKPLSYQGKVDSNLESEEGLYSNGNDRKAGKEIIRSKGPEALTPSERSEEESNILPFNF
jgi:hypothetical protein